MVMNEAIKWPKGFRTNKRRIIEVVLNNPNGALSYPWFKMELCRENPVMSERRLRSNLKSLVNQGYLKDVKLENGGVFYGFPNVIDDPVINKAIRSCSYTLGNATIAGKIPLKRITPEEMIEHLKEAKRNPVISPRERSKKKNKAVLKNYITSINWQIDACRQMIEKRKLEQRRKEIEDKYRKSADESS